MATTDKLILSPFERALKSLVTALALTENEIVRDATIKRFEYTYELAWKMIKRHLVWSGDSGVESFSRKELFREAARVGMIADAEAWFDYNEACNLTSHIYSERKAEEVYAVARSFVPAALKLLSELKKHHG